MSTQSRRKFVLQAGAVAVAPLIITSITRAKPKAADRKLGFAICGLGDLAESQIAPALQKTERCRLAGIITDNPTKAQAWQAKYGIPAKNVYS